MPDIICNSSEVLMLTFSRFLFCNVVCFNAFSQATECHFRLVYSATAVAYPFIWAIQAERLWRFFLAPGFAWHRREKRQYLLKECANTHTAHTHTHWKGERKTEGRASQAHSQSRAYAGQTTMMTLCSPLPPGNEGLDLLFGLRVHHCLSQPLSCTFSWLSGPFCRAIAVILMPIASHSTEANYHTNTFYLNFSSLTVCLSVLSLSSLSFSGCQSDLATTLKYSVTVHASFYVVQFNYIIQRHLQRNCFVAPYRRYINKEHQRSSEARKREKESQYLLDACWLFLLCDVS